MVSETEVHPSPIYQELCQKIGREKVYDDETMLVTYGYDISPMPFNKPGLVVLPECKEDVSETLKLANRHKIPVTPMSAGVTMSGLSIPSEGGIVLDFRSMNKVIEINTDSGYAVIEPGVTFDKFTSALRKKGYRCHVPTSPGTTTVLSNYLMASSGSLVNRHMDSIVSLQVVLADGTVVDTGMDAWASSTPFKRYSPLPDLTGLFCCSYGTLGVVTKGSVRIYPINEANRVHLAGFDDYATSVRYVKDVINNNICEHSIIWSWPTCITYDISVSRYGETKVPAELFNDPRQAPQDLPYNIVTTFIAGYDEMVQVAESTCNKVAERYGGRPISEAEMKEKLPEALYAWTAFYGEYHQPGMYHVKKYGLGKYVPWIVHSEPGKSAEIEKFALDSMWEAGLNPICYYAQPYDFGRAMFFRVYSFVDPGDTELLKKVGATYKKMYDTVMEKYGAVPNRCRAADAGESSYLIKMGGYGQLLRSIKKLVDPNNILNPKVVF